MNSVRKVCSTRSKNLFLNRFHAQHAVYDVQRQLFGENGKHARGVFGADLRQHHGDGLRIFVLEIVGEHLLLHVGELLPHIASRRPADFLHDGADAFGRKELLQQALGGVVVTHDRTRSGHARDEFEQKIFDLLGLDRAERRHDD